MVEGVVPPSGTVTFLFTDIEGSTELWDRDRSAMSAAVARHDHLAHEVVDRHSGYVFTTAGDSFAVAFRRAADAVNAAAELQRRLAAEFDGAPVPLRVRMALHSGECEERDGDYFGPAVARAARVMGLAAGGQVLVSRAVQDLACEELAGSLTFRELGEYQLRGLSRPELIFELRGPGLRDGFPAPAGTGTKVGNLPSPPSSFVGRTGEILQLGTEVESSPLVTLVGPGGVGKTRLSIEVAAAVHDEFPGGTWFVELGPVAEPDAVVHAIAGTLSVAPEPGTSPLDSVVASLAGGRTLMVLDNCEHVVDAAADVAAAVGRGAPATTIMATSREPLHVAGERVWDVAPLDVSVEAVELFCQRAAALDRSFAPDESDRYLIDSICVRLDGVPLAIELAASRARSMPLNQLVERLDDRFRLLRSSIRGGAEERHATLRATVDWSYRLLSVDEQILFDRLSVFPGSFDLDAAEAVCGFEPVDKFDVADLLASLVDKSLVLIDRDHGRYRLLETLRQFGAEQVLKRDESAALKDRFLAHYVGISARAREWFEGVRNAEGRELFDVEWDNLRAAVEHAEATGNGEANDRLIRNSFWHGFWALRDEHARWAYRRAETTAAVDPEVLGLAAAWAALPSGDYEQSTRLSSAAISVASERAGAEAVDLSRTAIARWAQMLAAFSTGNLDDAQAANLATHQAIATSEDRFTRAFFTGVVSAVLDPDAASNFIVQAREQAKTLDNETLDSALAYMAGTAAYAAGDLEQASVEWDLAVQLAERAHTNYIRVAALVNLAACSLIRSDPDVTDLLRGAIEGHRSAGPFVLLQAVAGVAAWLVNTDRLADAGRLVGFLERHVANMSPAPATLYAQTIERVDAHQHARRWRNEGAAMTLDDVTDSCLDLLPR